MLDDCAVGRGGCAVNAEADGEGVRVKRLVCYGEWRVAAAGRVRFEVSPEF